LSDADLLSLSDTDVRVTLDLPGNRITGFGLAGIARSHILFLNLERNPLNDKGFQSMPRMPSIESLNVNGARLTDKGIPALEKLPALKDLSLSCPGVGDAGIAALKCCPGLVFLGLERTRVTDCGLLSLKSLGRLRDVGLTGSCVTAQGMRQFRNSMPSMIREPAEDDPDYDASHADWVKRTEELLQAIPVPTK
jgi:hypothetical protein